MDGTAEKEMTASEALPQTDTSYRLAAATRSPTNLRSVPVAEDSTHLYNGLADRRFVESTTARLRESKAGQNLPNTAGTTASVTPRLRQIQKKQKPPCRS